MTVTEVEPRLCACGCGGVVTGARSPIGEPAWKRGHKLKAQAAARKADQDEDAAWDLPDGQDDMVVTDELGDDLPDWLTSPGPGQPAPPAPPGPDKPPGRLREKRTPEKGRPRPRVTPTLKRDVEAKIRFVLLPAGKTWEIRDPMCGGTFVRQEPEISSALAEIVCDSPDLLRWFTGPAGGFMKYFRLVMAVQPVAFTVYAHHMAHGQVAADPTLPPQAAYAA